jgi:diguanylate cyclase (GGDEF)-like protein
VKTNVSTVQVIDSLAEITRYQDREILEKSLLETLAETVPSEEYRLYKVQRPPPKLELTIVANKTTDRDVISENQTNHALTESLQQAITDSIEREDVVTFNSDEHHHKGTIFPVFNKNGDISAVLVQFTDNFRFDDQRIVFGLLRIYSNYLNLLHENIRDKLTGLLNRETLNKEILKILMEKSHIRKKIETSGYRRAFDDVQYWLGVIDVDHFKTINDKFGHLFGDEVLILMASYMTEVFRDDDLLFRYGGEEFVVLIKVLSKEDAFQVFERMRIRILEHHFPQIDNLAVSIGMVEIDEQDGSSDVIHSADKALYYAKDHGRNQTCVYEELISEGKITEDQQIKSREIDLF